MVRSVAVWSLLVELYRLKIAFITCFLLPHAGAAGLRYAGTMNPLHPKKLLLTKWTATLPENREKHFIVTRVALPTVPDGAVEWVELEAVHSGRTRRIAWRALRDAAQWRQGWC